VNFGGTDGDDWGGVFVSCVGVFDVGFGGFHAPVFLGIFPSSESSCSKKSDIEK